MATRKSYPSDVSDEEWEFAAPYLALVREDALRRNHDLREVFNGLRWVVRTGLASVGGRLSTDAAVAQSGSVRGDGPRLARTFAAFGKPGIRSDGGHTRLPHPALNPPRAALGAVMTEPSARRAIRCTLRWTLWDT